jgi:hypothetical protein
MGAYCASKHAVEGMAKALRRELVPWSIHVSNVNPGFMRSPSSPCLSLTLQRTPILTKGVSAGDKTYNESPQTITSQYSRDWSVELQKVMTLSAEVSPSSDRVLFTSSLRIRFSSWTLSKRPSMPRPQPCGTSLARLLQSSGSSPRLPLTPSLTLSCRSFPLCNSYVTDLYNSISSSKTTPMPTPEAMKQFRS